MGTPWREPVKNRSIPFLFVLFACISTACDPATDPPRPAANTASGSPERTPERFLGTVQGAVKVCAAGPTTYGLDVSKWQGNIDWAKVAASGVHFVITRIAHGTGHDPYFESNWAAIKAHGMVRGAYQFYAPLQDAAAQAQEVINSVGMLQPGDLPVVLDVEWTDGTPNAKEIQKWVDLVTAGTGKRPMIYTALGYWNQYFTTEFKDLDLWVANWEATCPSIPAGWDNWLFWQTSGGGGTVPGIQGGVDENLFNGTLEELKYVAGLPNFTNCSAIHSLNCSKFGCACADNQCSGGFCDGTGCSSKVSADCGFFGCTCVDGACSGGACPGTGCTAKQTVGCSDAGQECKSGACVVTEIPAEDAGATEDAGGSIGEDATASPDTEDGSADVAPDGDGGLGGTPDISADPVDVGQIDVEANTDVGGEVGADLNTTESDGGSFVIPSYDVGSGGGGSNTDSNSEQNGNPPSGGQPLADGNRSDEGGCSTSTASGFGSTWLWLGVAIWLRFLRRSRSEEWRLAD